jgi:hypothetical protein
MTEIITELPKEIIYSSYTESQKKATLKYREKNKDKVNEQRKIYYQQRKENDPEFLNYKRAKSREYYQRKKEAKLNNVELVEIKLDDEKNPFENIEPQPEPEVLPEEAKEEIVKQLKEEIEEIVKPKKSRKVSPKKELIEFDKVPELEENNSDIVGTTLLNAKVSKAKKSKKAKEILHDI